MISLKNVTKTYVTKQEKSIVCNEISFDVKEGTSIGIVGLSGAGKSTLIRMINGLIKPSSGLITIDGLDIFKLSKKDLRSARGKISMIFQSFNLFSSMNVYQNVEFALKAQNYPKKQREERIYQVLDSVGLKDKAKAYPKSLSGGQQQRVSIARAIANNPKYLLCDEITSALDNKTALEIIDLLNKIREETNITIVFISHQLDIIRRICDEVVVLDNGYLLEHQEITKLFTYPKHLATKMLIHSSIYQKHYSNQDKLYQLTYDYNIFNLPILSDAVIKFKAAIDIVDAQVFEIKKKKIGILIVRFPENNKDQIIKYLTSNQVFVHPLF